MHPFYCLLFSLILLLALTGCRNSQSGKATFDPPAPNFYYWKTTLDFGRSDKALADSLGVKKLYLRYFDVDYSPTLKMPVPVGELAVNDWETNSWLFQTEVQIADFQIVPTVFITNRTFSQPNNPDTLAANIASKINDINTSLRWIATDFNRSANDPEITDWDTLGTLYEQAGQAFLDRITEVQIDCDWTPSTRKDYFSFLEKIQAALPGLTITCTVRLHQFRDGKKAGIPPVPRATLMCYNVAPPAELATANAIFDLSLVEGYLKNTDYPLPLEAALPIFTWGALFHENQFRGLANGVSANELEGNPLFVPLGQGRYRFTQDTVFAEVYMREGDLLRLDGPSTDDLLSLAGRLRQIKTVHGISFFDWNPDKIRAYHVDKIFEKYVE